MATSDTFDSIKMKYNATLGCNSQTFCHVLLLQNIVKDEKKTDRIRSHCRMFDGAKPTKKSEIRVKIFTFSYISTIQHNNNNDKMFERMNNLAQQSIKICIFALFIYSLSLPLVHANTHVNPNIQQIPLPHQYKSSLRCMQIAVLFLKKLAHILFVQ